MSIDFNNIDTLIFLAIILVLAVIVFYILIKFIAEIIKFINKIINWMFGIKPEKSKLNQERTERLHEPQAPREDIKLTKQNITDFGFNRNFSTGREKDVPEVPENQRQNYEGKERKDIEEGLAKLKLSSSAEEDTLESKMPPIATQPKEDDYEKIEIPTSKKVAIGGISVGEENSDDKNKEAVNYQGGTSGKNIEEDDYEKAKIPVPKRFLAGATQPSLGQPVTNQNVEGRSALVKDNSQKTDDHEKTEQAASESESFLFGKKSGQTRRILRYELKRPDEKTLRAERGLGLNLTREQRAKMVDKYFPKYYGQEITKEEFKKQIKKIERKPVADPLQRRQQIREVKLFKKIGGIK